MPTDTKLNQLIINQLTQEQYDEAKAAGTLSDTELYITDSDDDVLTNNIISNCITYIPQDIKLKLNNGTLTLKAGSKLYIPNGFETSIRRPLYAWLVNDNEIYYTESKTPAVGDKTFNEKGIYTYYKVHDVSGLTLVLQKGKDTDSVIMQTTVTRDTSKDTYFSKPDTSKPKFDVITIESDKIVDCGSVTGKTFIRVYQNQLPYGEIPVSIFYSGSDPSRIKGIFYNTTTNEIKYYIDGAATGNICSFPVAEITVNNGKVTSIDQIFNGFGYIGSTVYALPGIKGLIPNGRNADGSLRSTEFTLDKVTIETLSGVHSRNYKYYLARESIYAKQIWRQSVTKDWISEKEPTQAAYSYWYNPKTNIAKRSLTDASVWDESFASLHIFTCNITNDRITSFTPKTVFHALDYNDKSTISDWSMPSSRYIDLSLAASGSTYIAPANGWVTVSKRTNANNQMSELLNKTCGNLGMRSIESVTGRLTLALLPVKKGDTFQCNYTAGGTLAYFCFIFSEGEN